MLTRQLSAYWHTAPYSCSSCAVAKWCPEATRPMWQVFARERFDVGWVLQCETPTITFHRQPSSNAFARSADCWRSKHRRRTATCKPWEPWGQLTASLPFPSPPWCATAEALCGARAEAEFLAVICRGCATIAFNPKRCSTALPRKGGFYTTL